MPDDKVVETDMKTLKTQLEAALGDNEAFANIMTEVAKLPVNEAIALSKDFYGFSARSKKQAIGIIWQRQRKLMQFVEGAGARAIAYGHRTAA